MLLPHVTSGPLSLLLASTLALQSQTGSVQLAAVPPDPASEIAQGVAAFSARQPDLALRHFENALAVDSTSYEANWRAALALITLGNETPDSVKSPERDSLFAQAERDARRAVAADSLGADGHFLLARAMGQTALTKGKNERIRLAGEIRSEALRAIELNPRHDGAYHVMGRWNAEVMRLSGFSRFFARQFLGGAIFGQASEAVCGRAAPARDHRRAAGPRFRRPRAQTGRCGAAPEDRDQERPLLRVYMGSV